MIKRRQFLQYSSLGSASLLLASQEHSLASVLVSAGGDSHKNLALFKFDAPTVDRSGHVKRLRTLEAKFFPESLHGAGQLDMVAVNAGKFWMGTSSRLETQATTSEFPRHRVRLPSFFMSKYPITQAQWARVAALPKIHRELNSEPSHFQGDDRPVESISWLDAVEFCDRLSQHTGRQYQLPSEVQWEYACRAGTETPFNTGDTITSQLADYVSAYTYRAEPAGPYRQSTVAVGHFPPNAFGLHDMHGNVWEWCADSWRRDHRGAPKRGQAITAQRSHGMRTIRGGSWLDAPAALRSASRSGYRATGLNRTIGFRVVTASV